jgi:hypothetical protein
VEAVIGEPVSIRIPCFAGKYREISAVGADIGSMTSHSRANSRRPARVPYDSKQGIWLTEQGIALSLSRKHVSQLGD